MSNPYHDEAGRFTSKDGMRNRITELFNADRTEEATTLYLSYKEIVNAEKVQAEIAERAAYIHAERKKERRKQFLDMFRPQATVFSTHEWWNEPAFPEHPEDEFVQKMEREKFINEERYRNIKKMPALFVIDRQAHKATTDINENAAWLFTEASTPTIKRDGTSITVTDNGEVLARRSVKKGKQAPPGFIHAETDSYTGHQFGVEPIEQSGFHKMYQEAVAANGGQPLEPGTYELCGPKVNGNPENLETHTLIKHGSETATEIPDMRTLPREQAYETLHAIFTDYHNRGIEGVVWWGADGKRTKLRTKDFFGDPNRR